MPTPDRTAASLSVPCPECGAPAGEECERPMLSTADRKRRRFHRERRVVAGSSPAESQRRLGIVCEICGAAPKSRALHRDHDHRTGAQRGLICFTCNRYLLGKYATAAKLRAAADYLDKYAGAS